MCKQWEILFLCSARINPITLFSVHVNTTFRFITRNEFSPIEPTIVHANVATDSLVNTSLVSLLDESMFLNKSLEWMIQWQIHF